MEKINFVNNTTPALNSTNLNKLQDNVEDELNEIKSKFNYSTTEEIIIGTWINNKPIYRKTVYISGLPSNDEQSYDIGITNIDCLVNMYGTYSSSNPSYSAQLPINFIMPDSQYIINTRYMKSTNQIRVFSGLTSGSTYSGYVTLEYTKTTD